MFMGAAVAAVLLTLIAWVILRAFPVTDAPGASTVELGQILLGWLCAITVARFACVGATRAGLVRRRILVFGDDAWPPGPEAGRLEPFEIVHLPIGAMTLTDALRPDRLRAGRICAVVAADPSALAPSLRQHCLDAGVRVLTEDELLECRLGRVATDRLPGDWLRTARGTQEGAAQAVLRRAFDISVGLALILLTLPVTMVAALAIRFDNPGPVFYRQERCGKDGRVFTLFKFRSMTVDAECGGVPVWAVRRDPRVTRVGRFIRLTRIDELPQILNVLRGDMSIIGPRPERPGFVAELGRVIPHYDDRACVRPGITGWAQVNYPYGASVEDARMKLAYDLYYVRNRSFFLDLLILVATVRVVLFQEGAR
ncbi:exopolysaccharide biosynthesis polyprenyl glycosylphosphotransferase [Humitalea sp. 24SJ18S-53]|uniref:exopolysaccharide biosynthesis polyprenyl glycosylphosphotransferase n=1 Tax=Humitalea sp. 24SJ18S-53 TaxID=3422307 RepID=UPI003D67DF14